MGLLLTSFTDRSTHLPPVARRDLSKNIFFFIAKFEFVVRPVTIGRFSEVVFSDFRLSSGTIATKSRKNLTFLLISSQICHF